MAEKVTKASEEKQEVKKPVYETKYCISELVEAAGRFGAKPVVVKTALENAGKSEYTISDAERIIKNFKNKEVRI